MQNTNTITRSAESVLSTNRVLRNTYALLAATLLFSGVMAAISMAVAPPRGMSLICTLGALGVLMFLLPKYENSSTGVGIVFLGTGLLGFGLGPMLNAYAALPNGSAIVATAMGGTGVIFLALSAYVLTTKKTFEFMGGMLFVGLIVVFGAAIINIFAQIPALSLVISSAIVLLMSGFILFDTSRIVNGGETNYIRATVSMFLNIFNLFTSLLHLLGIMSDD
ncbi:Bax inhibitor-1/YccA family protein [Granulosicoccus sp. 3-233]|uniref:Bax inhibitor-1/YccA family protein n=1 Tax=Granulosicoccus sp. 3-233 TaxID=3417969 RepID=UPI003D352A21